MYAGFFEDNGSPCVCFELDRQSLSGWRGLGVMMGESDGDKLHRLLGEHEELSSSGFTRRRAWGVPGYEGKRYEVQRAQARLSIGITITWGR